MDATPGQNTATAPAISVIVPCYKVRDYVVDCARSLFRQTLQEPFEIILVDDCDPEHSVEEVRKIEAEKPVHISMQYILREQNGGLSAARNTGTEAAAAEYVFYLDSDDELAPHALETMLAEARKTGADVTVGITRRIPAHKGDGIHLHCEGFFSGQDAFDAFMGWKIDAVAWNKLVKRGFLSDAGIAFRDRLIHEDEVWNVDVLLAGASYACIGGEPTYLYKIRDAGSITSVAEWKRLHWRVLVCNINSVSVDAKGFKDDMAVHDRLCGMISGAVVNVFRRTPRSAAGGDWSLACSLARQLMGVSPAFRRHMRLSGSRMCKHLARALALPVLGGTALTLYLYYLAKRVSPA